MTDQPNEPVEDDESTETPADESAEDESTEKPADEATEDEAAPADQSAAERENNHIGLGASAQDAGGPSKPEDPQAVPTNEPTAPGNPVHPAYPPPGANDPKNNPQAPAE